MITLKSFQPFFSVLEYPRADYIRKNSKITKGAHLTQPGTTRKCKMNCSRYWGSRT